jgi:hypothetical protein
MTADLLKDHILRAVARVELELGVTILPVEYKVRLPFDRNEYNSYGFIQLPHRPVRSIVALTVVTATGTSVYSVPLEWVSPGHLSVGQVTVVPMQPAVLSAGMVPSSSSGSSAFLLQLANAGFIPEYWQI